jgi:hypothetical protein
VLKKEERVMGYLAISGLVLGLAALAWWDYRARRKGHRLRNAATSLATRDARWRDFRGGPSGSVAGVPVTRMDPPPRPVENDERNAP